MKTFADYATASPEYIIQAYNACITNGLSSKQVAEQRKLFGDNNLKKKKSPLIGILKRQLKDPFLYMLVSTSALSFFLGEHLNGALIGILAIISITLSVYQEYFAEKTIMLLNKMVSFRVKVLRNRKIQDIPSEELVPGDIMLIETGCLLSADIRVLQAENLVIDESTLTGESKPITKVSTTLHALPSLFEAINIGFTGTTVISGKGLGIVIGTGQNTIIGSMTQAPIIPRKTAFTQGIDRLTFFIFAFVLSVISIVFCINLLIKGSTINVWQMLIFSISLAITVIPEALNVVISFSLSIGARLLAKKNVIVKRLSSIDDFGSISILCTDKTGTITTNELSVQSILSCENESDDVIARHGILCSNEFENNKPSHEPFDIALEQYCIAHNISYKDKMHLIARIPFDPVRRRAVSLIQSPDKIFITIRGAYEEIITRCKNITPHEQQLFQRWIDQHEERGCRILAIANKELIPPIHEIPIDEQELKLIGLISFSDTLKPTAAPSIKRAQQAGIAIKILSGDSPQVTKAVAKKIGLLSNDTEIITGNAFSELSQEEKKKTALHCVVFARVTPDQKCEIVTLLQEDGDVGFLGEGINDAGVLKIATVGIAVNNASDIAKEAADVIILENNLGVIIDGIMTGRRVFSNTLKYLQLTLSANFSSFYTISVASLIMDHLPMLPLQLLMVNLLSDVPMIFIATDKVDNAELKRPKHYKFKKLISTSIIFGIVCTICDFMFLGTVFYAEPAVMQTNWFIFSILTECTFFLCIRTMYPFWRASVPSRSLSFMLIGASAITFLLTYSTFGANILGFVPPNIKQIGSIFLIMIINVIGIEIVKAILMRYYNNNNHKHGAKQN